MHITKGNIMSNTVEQLKAAMDTFLAEDGKLIKARRNEITAEKNARKEAKAA
jgi:hypothetical protein